MNTRNPISTISFNSQLFLKEKLDQLVDARLLSFWAFVRHDPEDDESGNKNHIHLYAEPTKQIQTDELGRLFFEYPDEYSKPLKCILWRRSQFADWYLYGLHDVEYLASKNQSRKYHYCYEDFVYSDEDQFLYYVKSIDMLQLSPYKAIRDAVSSGLSFEEFFKRGSVPLNQIEHYQYAFNLIRANTTNRNGRLGHE